MTSNTYDQHLERNAANFQAWTPLSFLERTAGIFPDHVAVVHGDIRRTYRDLFEQARRLASALTKAGYWSNEDIMAWCRARLATFQCPRHLIFGEVPKTSTGKIQKYVLRQRALAE
jgi:fatty-acyl-CoA synthase